MVYLVGLAKQTQAQLCFLLPARNECSRARKDELCQTVQQGPRTSNELLVSVCSRYPENYMASVNEQHYGVLKIAGDGEVLGVQTGKKDPLEAESEGSLYSVF